MKSFSLLLISILIIQFSLFSQIQLDSTTLDTTTVKGKLDIPWEIIWGPDDQIWTTERFGRVSRIDPNTGNQDVILDISASVYESGEAGLLGMALHPDFSNSPYVYLTYTYISSGNARERMVRYEYNGTTLVNPLTIIEDIAGNSTHIGCRLLILPDNTLLMTTGDAQNQNLPQNTSSMSGKTLRFNLDGSIPNDNPIANSPVWTWGHRNAQGLLVRADGKVYSSEHGPTTDDEINIIEKGRNYGWPNVHGMCDSPAEIQFCNDSNVFEPILNWTPTIATSDIVWYDHPSIPEFQNSMLMAVLKDKRVIGMRFNAAGDSVTSEKNYFQNVWGRIRDICVSPTGDIYLATNGQSWSNTDPFTHSIVKLSNSTHPAGVSEINSRVNFKIWPQPANQVVKIQFFNDVSNGLLSIVNTNGQVVKDSIRINKAQYELDISDLSKGLYFIQLKVNENQVVKKLIVN